MREVKDPASLIRCAHAVASAIGPQSCALIGGLAMSAFGYVRGTTDVEFIAEGSPQEIVSILSAHGIYSEIRSGEVGDPLPWVIVGYAEDIKFDILPQMVNTQVKNGVFIEELGLTVCSLKDLIALKCYAGGPQDLLDVANLVEVRPDIRSATLILAKEHGVLAKVTRLISRENGRRGLSEHGED